MRVDLLSETVAAIRTGSPTSGMFIRHAPWGRRYPVVPGAGFHVVLEGSCWLLPPQGEPIALAAGDVVFMPRGADHDLVDALGTPVTEVARPGEPREVTGPGVRCVLLCGAYEIGRRRSHPLLADLPDFVHLPARLGGCPSLRGAVDLLSAEVGSPQLGSDAAIPALLDTLLLFLLRSWFAGQSPRGTGWAAALADPAVATALRAVHEDPAHPWTVPDLAGRAGVSRATLSRRFAGTIGESPLAYLTRWRLLTAARLLRDSDAPLHVIAGKVGYTSEFAFAKAFKREYGIAPGRYRRRADDPPVIAV